MKALDQAKPWEGDDDAISERAAEFFAQRRFGGWTDADQAELDAWLAESTLHRVAWLRLEGIAARTDHLATVHTFKIGPGSGRIVQDGGGRFDYRRFVFPLLAAASIASIAALAIPFVRSLMEPPVRSFATNVGGRALLKFADGTQIELNTGTAVRYRMTTAERTVWLDRGEAYFRVAHNAADPFVVMVGDHRITDLGTEFLVRDDTSGLDVVLVKGRAQLNSRNSGTPVAILSPGYEAVATPISTTITKKSPQELADELAWRRGMLVFRSTRLADAVREVNRYNQTKLVIADPSIADLKVTGEIRNDNFEDFLDIAQGMMKLRADRQGKNVLLSRELPERTKRAAHVRRSSSEAVAQ